MNDIITAEVLKNAGFYEIHWNPNFNGGYFEYRLHEYERPGSTVSITFGDRLPEYQYMVWLATVGNRIGLPHVNTLNELGTLCYFLTGNYPTFKQATKPTISELTQTCEACPSQWGGRTLDGRHVYIRYRWGKLCMGIGDTPEKAVESAMNDGVCKIVGDEYDGLLSTGDMMRALVDVVDFFISEGEGPLGKPLDPDVRHIFE